MKLPVISDLATARIVAAASALQSSGALPPTSAKSLTATARGLRNAVATRDLRFVEAYLAGFEAIVVDVSSSQDESDMPVLVSCGVRVFEENVSRIRGALKTNTF